MLAAAAVGVQPGIVSAFVPLIAGNLFEKTFEFACISPLFFEIELKRSQYIGTTSNLMVAEGGTAPPSAGKASSRVL